MPSVQATSCGVKDAFPARRAALAAARHQTEHADRIGRRRPTLSVYRCLCCAADGGPHYHVGGVDAKRPRHTRRGDY